MKIVINHKIVFILAISLILANSASKASYALDEEEEPLIEARQIDSRKVNNLKNRTYDEGITIREIEVVGNNLVKTDHILQKISLKKGAKFNKDQVQKDLKTIYDMGYFTEKLKVVPENSSTGIKLRIEVEENVPITGFNVTGNTVVSSEELSKIFKSQTGLPQNIAELNKAVADIEKLYADKGYILSRVNKINDDPDGMINIEINEGIVDEIKISGNTRTKDFVIKRNLVTAPGMIYNENILKQDLSRIFATNSFSDIRRVLKASPADPDKYQLTIEVDEKRTGSISLGGGLDTGTGLFGTLGYADTNFRGAGQELSVSLGSGTGYVFSNTNVAKKASFQLEGRFLEPRLMQSLTSLETTAFARNYASYQVPLAIERRIGSEIEFARPIKKVPHLGASFSLGVEQIKLTEGDEGRMKEAYIEKGIIGDYITKRAEQLSGGTYISLGPSLVYDTRNSILDPTSGWYASASLKESFMISGDAGTFGKVSTDVRKYYPIGKRSTLAVGGKISSKVIGDLPEFASFRLGGTNNIRGYREGGVGNGSGFMMASAEFRTPIPFIDRVTKINFFRDIKTAFFMDAGTIFKENLSSELFNRPGYGISAGTGLRLVVPFMGPIRVDWGYPLTSLGAGEKRKGRFTFGLGDR